MLIILNLTTYNGMVVSSTVLMPEQELQKHSPENNSRHIQSCSIKLYNAKSQDYDTEQKIAYNASGKVEKFEDLVSHPKIALQYYYYDSNNLCTSFVYMLGKDMLTKEDYTYNINDAIKYKKLTSYIPSPSEPTIITQEYDYDSTNLLIEKRTLDETNKIASLTHYTYSNNKHIATQSYNSDKRLVYEVSITCDSALLFPKYFPQKKLRVCKNIEWNDTTHLIRVKYYTNNKKSNYTTEEVIQNQDSTTLSVTVLSRKKKYILTYKYNEKRKVIESTITINDKQESKKIYTYDPNNDYLIKSEEYGPKNQLYSRYKYEYRFF